MRAVNRRGLAAVITAVTLFAGMDSGAAAASSAAVGSRVAVDSGSAGRRTAVELMKTGGPELARAAEGALLGSDEDLRDFLAAGQAAAAETEPARERQPGAGR
ncbi:ALF repeat-containing protein [Nonomuraea sp. NPDC049480]|uniref:ALF repeat-containing protein n=1 Tax=Nonomuraea sp. NPDC049480 TaxID=3364353 RepID=UPI0037AA61F7